MFNEKDWIVAKVASFLQYSLDRKKTILLSLDTERPNIVQLSYNFCLKIFTNLLARRVFCSTIEKIYLLILIRKYTQ